MILSVYQTRSFVSLLFLLCIKSILGKTHLDLKRAPVIPNLLCRTIFFPFCFCIKTCCTWPSFTILSSCVISATLGTFWFRAEGEAGILDHWAFWLKLSKRGVTCYQYKGWSSWLLGATHSFPEL